MLATANSLQSESRNLGLHQIYPEPGNNDSGKDVDIIAIHGLDTQSPKQWVAWKKDGDPTSGEVHWLKDAHMLPHRIPNARISTYDWNANVDRGTAADSLFGFADQFLEELHIRILEGVKDRPIVFLASCFGGLLLIRALCRAFESQSEYQHILQSTAGVIFLGTPFQGSNETFSDAAQLRASVAVAAGRQGATELASYLQQDYKLDEMVQVFREMVKKEQFSFPIACYYETLESDFRSLRKQLPANLALEIRRDSGILVDKHSATLPGEKALPLNVRHSMISKYSTSDNQGFRTLSFRIEGMVKNARDTINRKRAVQQVSHESRGTIQVQANATETATATRTGGDPDPRDTTGLCLLSLDGGGVRGLSTIYILERIMHRLNDERRKSRLPRVKPCEVFDLIGGTGTGGLIAIMLGRLEMDVDQCIEAYNSIAASVFGGGPSPVPVDPTGKVPAPFDLAALKRAIRKMITASGASEKDVFNDGAERGCKTFVCTADRHTKDIVRLRSYTLSEERNIRATICEAALATSATTTFFEPVRIGARSFADGGLGANNPVDEVEGEASNIWCPGGDDLKPLVKCFISIGTGNPGKRPFEEGMADYLAQTVVQIATETEATETKFIARWMKHFDEKRYFRLNVDQGLQDIGLAEYERQGAIEAATDSYLGHADRKIRVRDCIRNLRSKQNKADTTLSAFIYASVAGLVLFGPTNFIRNMTSV